MSAWGPVVLLLAAGNLGFSVEAGSTRAAGVSIKAVARPAAHDLLPPERASALLGELRDLAVLDVRTPREFSRGRLAKALNLDFYSSDFEARLAALDRNRPYLVYCAVGGRSAEAAAKMKALGFREVHDLAGGYKAWKRGGFPTIK